MREMVFETVWRPSVSLSVRPAIHPPRAAAEGLLLSAVPEGDVDRQRRRRGAEQHWHRSTALSSKREQCHVGGWRRKLDTDLSEQGFVDPRTAGRNVYAGRVLPLTSRFEYTPYRTRPTALMLGRKTGHAERRTTDNLDRTPGKCIALTAKCRRHKSQLFSRGFFISA